MSADLALTILIGMAALAFVGNRIRLSGKQLLATSREDAGPGCSGCTGCGTSKGHADSPDACSAKDSLIVLGEKTPTREL